jgi:hypothetical protein
MDGCVIVPLLLLLVVLFFVAERHWEEKGASPPERHMEARSPDPGATYRAVMAVVDEVHGRWYEGRHHDEVVHLHLPGRAEMARHDSDLRGNLGWLEREAGEVDVVLHYEGEPPLERRAVWDRVERSADGSIRRPEWRRKQAGYLPLLGLVIVLVMVIGVLVW